MYVIQRVMEENSRGERREFAALRVSILHKRIAHLSLLALNLKGCDRLAIELSEVRTELSDIFELIRPNPEEKS